MLSLLRFMRRRNEAGFTLIELMVVVLIIGILAAIAIPVFLHLQQEAAKASVKSDVRNTVTNTAQYLIKNPTATELRAGATWTPGDLGARGVGIVSIASALVAGNLTSKDVHGVAETGLDIVVSENNNVEVYGDWQNYRIYGQTTSVSDWVYAYYSNFVEAPASVKAVNTEAKQYAEVGVGAIEAEDALSGSEGPGGGTDVPGDGGEVQLPTTPVAGDWDQGWCATNPSTAHIIALNIREALSADLADYWYYNVWDGKDLFLNEDSLASVNFLSENHWDIYWGYVETNDWPEDEAIWDNLISSNGLDSELATWRADKQAVHDAAVIARDAADAGIEALYAPYESAQRAHYEALDNGAVLPGGVEDLLSEADMDEYYDIIRNFEEDPRSYSQAQIDGIVDDFTARASAACANMDWSERGEPEAN